jgi:riboflavin biosynthesis pyrimidine reductase
MSLPTSADIAPGGKPLELLFEQSGLPSFEIPEPLLNRYSGALGFGKVCLFANFVASLDGIVALPGDKESGQIISDRNPADRFVMGLLRACSDAVLIGAGTYNKSSGHVWSAERIYPLASEWFLHARAQLGLSSQPMLVLLTNRGEIDLTEPAARDALVITSTAGAEKLRQRAPGSARIVALGSETVNLTRALDFLRAEGLSRVLTEGGPSLFASLVGERLLDELFVTCAPALFGRFPGDQRKALAEGLDLGRTPCELLSARRHGSLLFLRYLLVRQDR